MIPQRRFLLPLFLLSLFLNACTHHVFADYPKYLGNNSGVDYGAKIETPTSWEMTKASEEFEKGITSFQAGLGNTWNIDFGNMLRATMKSSDVIKVFNGLEEAKGGKGLHIVFDMKHFNFTSQTAEVKLSIKTLQKGAELFTQEYEAKGNSQGGKMFFGGAWAMKNAIQQSTKVAMDDILKRYFKDLDQRLKGKGSKPTS